MLPITGGAVTPPARLALFLVWLALALWLVSGHAFWRDEVRAFTLALSGSNIVEMLRNVHGEGHPALWYLILRGGHQVFPHREVLPVTGALIGIGAMALVAFLSPFRIAIIALVLFSYYGAFEYVAIARNYGIAALVMLAFAALYQRIRNTLWLGVVLALLCNTNVPSCLIAAGFLLFRFVEMLTGDTPPTKRDWLVFTGNALLSAIGALLCFLTVYPTFNDAAVSPHLSKLGPTAILAGLFDADYGFAHLYLSPLYVTLSCLAFIRRPAAFIAAITTYLILKLFFYFVYPSWYRHEILYIFFLLSLFWMTAKGAGGTWPQKMWMQVDVLGRLSFILLLLLSSVVLVHPVREKLSGTPYSHSADVGRLLQRPGLAGAIVMADPDTMLEPLPYYVDNPLWMLRQQRFGKVVRLAGNAKRILTLDDVLNDAQRLHRLTGRPVIFLSRAPLQSEKSRRYFVWGTFDYQTVTTPDAAKRFFASMRKIATLRDLGIGDESYDVFLYPRQLERIDEQPLTRP